MSKAPTNQPHDRALVTVFEDLKAAINAAHALNEAGFEADQLELVTHDLETETHDLKTPADSPTTTTSMINSAERWGLTGAGTGAAAGLIAAIATGFPGLLLGMTAMGAATGAIVGGMSGAEQAMTDDRMNLPTTEDYKRMLDNGHPIVVVHGNHERLEQAKEVLAELPSIHEHVHLIRGHEFHEH